MKKVYFLLFFFLIFLFISCEKEIEYNGELGESVIVVNGVLEKNALIQVSLSVSTPSFGDNHFGENQYLNSPANLILTDNTTGETFTSNSNSTIHYTFGTTAIIGHSYSININHPDYLNTTAATSIPQEISILDWDTSTVTSTNMYAQKKLNLRWNDTEGENYYFVQLLSIDTITNLDNEMYISSFKINNGEENEGKSMLIFKDEAFNNSLCQLSLKFSPNYYYDNNGQMGKKKSYKVNIYNVSKELYNYYYSISKTGEGPFSEPVKVYTNITNGLGVFGGMNTTTLLFE